MTFGPRRSAGHHFKTPTQSARFETLRPDAVTNATVCYSRADCLSKSVRWCARNSRLQKVRAPHFRQQCRALFGNRVKKSLASAGFRPTLITIPAGEKSKTLEQVGAICDQMIAAGLDRQSFVIGLGGGMIGDISGFVAAIYHRGIPHVQIPTTLLAMVDSSIGGKTGVDTRAGKNLIGAFHQPSLVIDDLDRFENTAASAIQSRVRGDHQARHYRRCKNVPDAAVVEGRRSACPTMADQAQHPDQIQNRGERRARPDGRACSSEFWPYSWPRDRACRKLPEIPAWRSSEPWNCRRVRDLSEKSWAAGGSARRNC